LEGDLIDILVTEDREIHRACRRLNLDSRCHSLVAALEVVEDELPIVPSPPPAVRGCLAHELDAGDPIFDSLRVDYSGLDTWLAKCRREHRQCWVVNLPGRVTHAGVCIVNREDRHWPDASDPTLKICTFKIADDVAGMKLGELLLRAVFEYAHANGFATLFVEVFPKHGGLLKMLRCFGFEQHGHKRTGSQELVLRKISEPPSGAGALDPAEYHRLYGPYHIRLEGCRVFVVPIEPRYHSLLFPHLENQASLFPGTESCGNTIRKVYICNSGTTKIRPGDLLLFYRSRERKGITALGVVEETIRTREAKKLARFATKRTVYQGPEIEAKTCGREALGILFREAPILEDTVRIEELTKAGLLLRIPQSITELKAASLKWIRTHLK
jgi:L-amino acid N-acyltransferase YncA